MLPLVATMTAHKPTISDMMSLSYGEDDGLASQLVSRQGPRETGRVGSCIQLAGAHHVEGIRRESQRADGEANAQLEEEEERVDDEHHLDA